MNLYLISRDYEKEEGSLCGNYWDTYDSAVVAANNEDEARMIHPDGREDWDGKDMSYSSWVKKELVKVELIGVSTKNIKGVICASFNAG